MAAAQLDQALRLARSLEKDPGYPMQAMADVRKRLRKFGLYE